MPARLTEKPFVWAHRGASAYAPENTMEAFCLAAEMGADGIEIDVRFSKDKEIMINSVCGKISADALFVYDGHAVNLW